MCDLIRQISRDLGIPSLLKCNLESRDWEKGSEIAIPSRYSTLLYTCYIALIIHGYLLSKRLSITESTFLLHYALISMTLFVYKFLTECVFEYYHVIIRS